MSNTNPREIRLQDSEENKQGERPDSAQAHAQGGTPRTLHAVPQDASNAPSESDIDNATIQPETQPPESRQAGARGTAAMDPHTRQEVARKGGLAVSRNKQHMAEIGRKGGQSVSKNREHMARIGRKGGAASRGQRGES